MIERQARWYHYLMLPFTVQVSAVIASGVLLTVQLCVYAIMSDPVVEFSGACEVTVGGLDSEGAEIEGATMQCGGEPVDLGVLETPFLYALLTKEEQPVILCEKTVTEYIRETSWKCKMGNEEQ